MEIGWFDWNWSQVGSWGLGGRKGKVGEVKGW